jgi:hypothetical protein
MMMMTKGTIMTATAATMMMTATTMIDAPLTPCVSSQRE